MTFVVQLILVFAVGFGALSLVRGGSGAKQQAVRRVVGLLFFAFAAFSIFVPQTLSSIASFFGIGRGTDLVLYGFIAYFLIYVGYIARRNRQLESSVTKLARHIAISETDRPWDRPHTAAEFPDSSPTGDPGQPSARS